MGEIRAGGLEGRGDLRQLTGLGLQARARMEGGNHHVMPGGLQFLQRLMYWAMGILTPLMGIYVICSEVKDIWGHVLSRPRSQPSDLKLSLPLEDTMKGSHL